MDCTLCTAPMTPFAEATVLNKYPISYFKCSGCGFIQTEQPYWLAEAYSEAIGNSDVGLVKRNLELSRKANFYIATLIDQSIRSKLDSAGGGLFFLFSGLTRAIGLHPKYLKMFKYLFKRDTGNQSFLDFGAGYGLFVRLMRDSGFRFYWFDEYCLNIFARGFEGSLEGDSDYTLITAFELIEHVHDPVSIIRSLSARTDNILFSTELLPENSPKPAEWWYYSLASGQHISFFTKAAIRVLAERTGYIYYYLGNGLHLFTKNKLNDAYIRKITKNRDEISYLLASIHAGNSLVQEDYAAALNGISG